MALRIYSSNHIETLQRALTLTLASQPLANPFTPETVVTPTYAMARWLNLQIATELGVAANINYLRPSQWFWQLAQQCLPELTDEDVYSRQVMHWQLYAMLQSVPSSASFDNIRHYCDSDETGTKRWQLAQRLADCFDRYQWYRPEIIEDWTSGNHTDWQATLWRNLSEQLGPHHRPYQVGALIEQLQNCPADIETGGRFSLFALSDLPPLYLSVIEALARHNQLDLYIHSPTDQYWADLKSQKSLGQQRLQNPQVADLFETGNELLSAWGKQGQVFQDLLLQADMTESLDITLYQSPPGDTLLQQIQSSIFTIDPQPTVTTIDDSITVHVCHSAMRECQVLQDQLLELLNENAELQPEDILVMIPDISAYAASIEAVFRYQDNHGLNCNLSDLSLAFEHPNVMSFLQLVALSSSRFTRSEILGLLDNPAIRFHFGIDSSGHEDIIEFIKHARIKWGIDGDHKTSFGLPATSENTWQQARERFFAGYAFADHHLWQGIALLPYEDNHQNQQLGRFWYFFDQLNDWRKRLASERSATNWRLLLNELLTQFLGESEAGSGSVQQIREGIAACLPEGDMTLSPELVLKLLEKQLFEVEQPGQLYSGGITFCGLRPMRNIPFKVICLLGMNHDAFPRIDRPADFDLMKLQPRGGDPSYRMQDRYLMLETLLCCREKLYISYTGRSLKDNSEMPASTLVEELIDYIDANFINQEQEAAAISASIVQQHPMQAYSARQFTDRDFSYNAHWLKVSQLVNHDQADRDQTWPAVAIMDVSTSSIIEVEEIRSFLRHPLRYFFAEGLGIRLYSEETESDEEAFQLDGLERWQLRQQLAHNHLQQVDNSLAIMQAEGRLPHGAAASSSLNKIATEAEAWLTQLDRYRGVQKQSLLIDLPLKDELTLKGRVREYYPGIGLLSVCAGQLKGSQLLLLWFDHLLLSATGQLAAAEDSRIIATDQSLGFQNVEATEARRQLQTYCTLFQEARQRPLPVLPRASFAWAQEVDDDKARARAWSAWENRYQSYAVGDDLDPYVALMIRETGEPPFDLEEFAELARQLYDAALTHGASNA